MKKFFEEFKKFITRGNIVDMAVGIIIGSAFTAIVTALTNNIFKPLIDWALSGTGGFESAVTMLKPVVDNTTNAIDMTKSIYIDWGAFITAIINFFIVAFVLFLIIKTINSVKEANGQFSEKFKKATLNKEERKELKENGVNIKDKKAVKEYFDKKEERLAAEKLAEEEKAKLEAEEAKKHTTEALLEDIKALLIEQLKEKNN